MAQMFADDDTYRLKRGRCNKQNVAPRQCCGSRAAWHRRGRPAGAAQSRAALAVSQPAAAMGRTPYFVRAPLTLFFTYTPHRPSPSSRRPSAMCRGVDAVPSFEERELSYGGQHAPDGCLCGKSACMSTRRNSSRQGRSRRVAAMQPPIEGLILGFVG